MSDRELGRIAALLRKAESTDNEHEAEAYLVAAQRLATKASVDLAVARAHTAGRERRAAPVQRVISIGEPGKRGLRTFVQLFLAIGRSNNLTCDVARDSTRVHAYGFESDLDAVEAIYASLVVQMVRACDAFLKSGEHAAETVRRKVRVEGSGRVNRRTRELEYQWRVVERPVHTTTARITFQEAFAARIGRRLQEARDQAERQWLADAPAADRTGAAVVLRAREVELAEHYRAHSTARGTWAGNRVTVGAAERSRRAGDRAGRRARLGGEGEIGGARPGIGA